MLLPRRAQLGEMGAPAVWRGRGWLWPGLGVFAGLPGDNDRHAHLAHQLTIARRGAVVVECDAGRLDAPGVAIPAGRAHRMQAAGEVVSIYVEPLARGMRLPGGPACAPLTDGDCARLLDAVARLPDVQRLHDALSGGAAAGAPPDARWSRVAAALLDAPSDPPSRERLAALAGLSPSRFSHWFVERAGLPLRRYRKWLRLQAALAEVARAESLTRAAHAAGFADAAHMSRTFRAMFGVDPSRALSRLDWSVVTLPSVHPAQAIHRQDPGRL